MRIEALEAFKHNPHYMEKGDIKTVSDADGGLLASYGWVKDVETNETGQRLSENITLNIDNSLLGLTNTFGGSENG